MVSAVLALTLAACGGSDAEPDAAPELAETTVVGTADDGESSAGEEPTDEAAGSEGAAGDSDEGVEGDPGDGDSSGGDTDESEDGEGDGSCLVGNWVLTEEAMNRYYNAVEADGAEGLNFTVTGGSGVSFREDGSYSYTPAFELALDVQGIAGVGVVGGLLSGEYEIIDGVVTTTVITDSVDISVNISGITMTADDLGMSVDTLAPISSAPVDCSGENPALLFLTGAGGGRVPVELQPNG